jgi:hypothetical protein
MGEECNTHVRSETCIFILKGMHGKYDLEKLSIDRKVILKLILNVRAGECTPGSSGSS